MAWKNHVASFSKFQIGCPILLDVFMLWSSIFLLPKYCYNKINPSFLHKSNAEFAVTNFCWENLNVKGKGRGRKRNSIAAAKRINFFFTWLSWTLLSRLLESFVTKSFTTVVAMRCVATWDYVTSSNSSFISIAKTMVCSFFQENFFYFLIHTGTYLRLFTNVDI